MKNCALYGFVWALASAFLTLILFFAGLHSDPAKLSAAGWIGGLVGMAIAVACMIIGVRARRAEVPSGEDFTYGSAYGTAFGIAAIASVLSAAFTYVYWVFINPAIAEVIIQDQVSKLESSGLTGDRLDQATAGVRKIFAPIPQAVSTLVLLLIIGAVIALIVAGFLKRTKPAVDAPPVM